MKKMHNKSSSDKIVDDVLGMLYEGGHTLKESKIFEVRP